MNIPNAIVVDTNVLIHDPNAIKTLMNDINVLYIHSTVLMELDSLKTKRDIGRDCREAVRIIEKLHLEKNPRLVIVNTSNFTYPNLSHLDPKVADHRIIALAYDLKHDPCNTFKGVKLFSNDIMVRILARDLGLISETFQTVRLDVKTHQLKTLNVPHDIIQSTEMDGDDYFTFHSEDIDIDLTEIEENEGVLCFSDWNGIYPVQDNSKWEQSFTAIRKGNYFKIISNDINVMGITPYSMDEKETNWEQYIAMEQLLDPDIKLSFLMGGTGSGKTLLALAAALHQRRHFRNILVTRPMVHLEDEDKMGFLPGSIQEKMGPWLKPIWKSINVISDVSDSNKKIIEKVRGNNKIDIEPLDYIRGMTYIKDLLIVDEAQNLTPHQIKTIITRCGEGSKVIFTGDLGQIDRLRKIDAGSSGLTYASTLMCDNPMVSISHFKKTVRSPLANLAEELL